MRAFAMEYGFYMLKIAIKSLAYTRSLTESMGSVLVLI